jgi:hypothetical protein
MNVSGPLPPATPAIRSSVTRAIAGAPQNSGRAADSAGGSPAATRTGQAESLWDLLTPEERDFFTKAATMGPLTYRPGGKTNVGGVAPTGQRIDVKG